MTLGYGFTCWTLERLIAHLAKETGIRVSINTMRSVLESQNYVCRRPKHDLKPLQDPVARTTAKDLLTDLKKAQAGEVQLFAMDETTLSLQPILRRGWMKRGRQRAIPAAGQQKHYHLFAALNLVTQAVIWHEAKQKNTDSFLRFLEHFMRSVDSTIPVILLLDNASYHHSAAAESLLAFFEDDGLIACWLPPYCSDLNPIERFWEYLKAFACANKLFPAVSALVDSARACLHMQNDFTHPARFLFLNTS